MKFCLWVFFSSPSSSFLLVVLANNNTSPAALHPVAGPWASAIVRRLFARMQDAYCFHSPNRTEVKMGQNKKALSIVCCILGIVLWFYGATASSRMFCQLCLSLPFSLSLSLSLSASYCLFVCSLCNWFYSSQWCCCFAGHNARPNDTTRPVAAPAPTPMPAAAALLRFCLALACAPCRCSCTSAARGIYLICWHRVAAAGTAVPLSWFRFYCLSLLSTWRAAPAPLPPLTLYLSLSISNCFSISLSLLLLSIVSSCRGCCAACDFITVDFWPSGCSLLPFFPRPLSCCLLSPPSVHGLWTCFVIL